jgi:hypothetical protein
MLTFRGRGEALASEPTEGAAVSALRPQACPAKQFQHARSGNLSALAVSGVVSSESDARRVLPLVSEETSVNDLEERVCNRILSFEL